ESRRLLRVHPPPDHSHAERGHLVVGNVALRVPLNKSVDLVRGQLASIALALDELNDAHDGTAYGFSGKLSWHLSEKARDSSTGRGLLWAPRRRSSSRVRRSWSPEHMTNATDASVSSNV